jgi:hypothetical protein
MTKRKRRSKRKGPAIRYWRGTDIVVTYKGLDHDKGRAVRKALGKYDTGSGFGFDGGQRDHTATVPEGDLVRVLSALKKIPGVRTKKCVVKWVLCR